MQKKNINGTWFLLDSQGQLVKGGFPNEKTIDRYIFFLDSLPSEDELRKKRIIKELEKEGARVSGDNESTISFDASQPTPNWEKEYENTPGACRCEPCTCKRDASTCSSGCKS